MPTPKPFLFFLALLFLIIPASADLIDELNDNSNWIKTSSGSIWTYNWYIGITPEYAGLSQYFESDNLCSKTQFQAGRSTTLTGYLTGNFDLSEVDYLTWNVYSAHVSSTYMNSGYTKIYIDGVEVYSFSTLGTSSYTQETFDVRNCGENTEIQIKLYNSNRYNYVGSTTFCFQPIGYTESEPVSSFMFSNSEASPSDNIDYTWSIDPYYTGVLDEVYENYVGEHNYYILFDAYHETNPLFNGEFLVVPFLESSGSSDLYAGSYYHNSNMTITANLYHEATYYDMVNFNEPFTETELLATDYITVLAPSSESEPETNETATNETEIEDPLLPDLPDPFGNGSISDPNGTEVVEGGNYSYNPDENGTINSTWIAGYKRSVDKSYQPLDDGVTGFLSYTLYPMTSFTGYLLTLIEIATVTLTTVLTMVMSVSVVITACFSAVPDKVLIVGTYALLLDTVAVVLGK